MQDVANDMMRDARGAVFVEKLIAYLPLMMTFFVSWELAEFTAASLVVQRASAAAGRAAVVVLPDDPVFYDGEAIGSYSGRRKDDVELAAGMVLSANPKFRSDFTVDVSDPPETVGPIDVTVTAQYACGAVSFFCGGDGAVELTSRTTHTYQGAKYAYTSPSGGSVGGTTQAMVADADDHRAGERSDEKYRTGGNGTGNGSGSNTCRHSSGGTCLRNVEQLGKRYFQGPNVRDCSDVTAEIRGNFEQTLKYAKPKCVTQSQAVDALARDLQMRDRQRQGNDCKCVPPSDADYRQFAEAELNGNQCRGFTDYKDQIFIINGGGKSCEGFESDILHETIHVMSGPGGTTPVQKQNNSFNEAITQWYTKESASGPVRDAYTQGDSKEWMDCLDRLQGQPGFQSALCETYFKGDADALSRALLAKWKQTLKPSERTMSDQELTDKIGKYNLREWKQRLCN